MALGRPGLEPCVPLEVRFRVVIDQWSRARDPGWGSVSGQFYQTHQVQRMSEEIPKALHLFFKFYHLTQDPSFHSHLLSSALKHLFHLSQSFTSHLTSHFTLFAMLTIRGLKQLKLNKMQSISLTLLLSFPVLPRCLSLYEAPKHGLNRRLPGQSDIHRQRTPPPACLCQTSPAPRTARERGWVGEGVEVFSS